MGGNCTTRLPLREDAPGDVDACQWKEYFLYSGLICNCSPRASFEEVDDEEDDGSNCK